MHRGRIVSLGMAATAALLSAGVACAFIYGGHHYTILAVIQENEPSGKPADRYKALEAFCAELPDLSAQLDAATLRWNILTSGKDWGWGSSNECQTDESRHMVVTQYYLHALTGLSAMKVRLAARGIIQKLTESMEPATSLTESRRSTLVCARGFALHLLGDTYAHWRLDKEPPKADPEADTGVLYPTGMGHARESPPSLPDYMLERTRRRWKQDDWSEWAQDVNAVFEYHKLAPSWPMFATAKNIKKGDEDTFRKEIKKFATDKWLPYHPHLEDWELSNHWYSPFIDKKCQEQLDHAVREIGGFPSGQLDCREVWNEYLPLAVREFEKPGREVGVGQNPEIDASCNISNETLAN